MEGAPPKESAACSRGGGDEGQHATVNEKFANFKGGTTTGKKHRSLWKEKSRINKGGKKLVRIHHRFGTPTPRVHKRSPSGGGKGATPRGPLGKVGSFA